MDSGGRALALTASLLSLLLVFVDLLTMWPKEVVYSSGFEASCYYLFLWVFPFAKIIHFSFGLGSSVTICPWKPHCDNILSFEAVPSFNKFHNGLLVVFFQLDPYLIEEHSFQNHI